MVKQWQIETDISGVENLGLILYRDLSTLPYVEKAHDDDLDDCAVYFVFDGNELVYVGSSGDIYNRLNYWFRDRRYARKHWTRIAVLPVPLEIRFTAENHYIRRLRPRDNNEWVE